MNNMGSLGNIMGMGNMGNIGKAIVDEQHWAAISQKLTVRTGCGHQLSTK